MRTPAEDQGWKPGDRVVLIPTGECGIVVHSWLDEEMGAQDYYVAFFGDDFPLPNRKPQAIPYVLRYSSTALRPAP